MKSVRGSILTLFIGLSLNTLAQDVNTIETGTKAPGKEIALQTLDGKTTNLEQEKGAKGLIVIFSCNTCPFVVGNDNFPGWESRYNEIYEKANALGIRVVLVNSNEAKRGDEDSPEAMKKHAADLGYKMPYLIDSNSALANLFGAKTTPHVFFFNEQMELVYSGSIDNSYESKRKKDENYLLDALTAFQENQPIVTASTPPRGCSIKRVKM